MPDSVIRLAVVGWDTGPGCSAERGRALEIEEVLRQERG